MADYKTNRIDADHDEWEITMNGAEEAASFERRFPRNMPSTHAMRYEWHDQVMPSKQVRRMLRIKPAPIENGAAAIDAAADPRKALAKLSVPDLTTKAVELGITVDPKWNKAQLVAVIVEKQAAARAE